MGANVDVVQFAIQGLDGLLEFDLERLLQGGSKRSKESGSVWCGYEFKHRADEARRMGDSQPRRAHLDPA